MKKVLQLGADHPQSGQPLPALNPIHTGRVMQAVAEERLDGLA